jgi:protein N-lysine methyltransferase METTL21D
VRSLLCLRRFSSPGFSLALCSQGWDVVATDTRAVLSTVLQKNVDSNRLNLPEGSGAIQTRELDWTVHPELWTWSHPTIIASHDYSNSDLPTETLHPPFDLILTADTLYTPELVGPLLRVLNTLSVPHSPPIYLALERRDPRLANDALQQARELWSFSVQRVPDKKVTKALVRAGCKWDRDEWEGVEIWKLVLQRHHEEAVASSVASSVNMS